MPFRPRLAIALLISTLLPLILTGCFDFMVYQGPNERPQEYFKTRETVNRRILGVLDTGNLAVRYDLEMVLEIPYKDGEKDYDAATEPFKLYRKTAPSLQDFEFKGVYPKPVGETDYLYTEPLLQGRWEYSWPECRLILRDGDGQQLLLMRGKQVEILVSDQGQQKARTVMRFEIQESDPNQPALKPIVAIGHFYSTSLLLRCEGQWD